MADSPYPQLKQSHTMAKTGRPWTDRKPPPATPVWGAIQGLASYWILRTAVELGLFDALEQTGPVAADVVAETLDASAPHTQSLLDSLVVLGLLDQVAGTYELNDTAARYLVTSSPASMADLIPVAAGPPDNWPRLAETVRTGRPAAPVEDDPAAFYVPLVEGTFATQLRVATRADLRIGYSRLVAPRLLDLGAGGAPWTVAVLTACPNATAVVNDLAGVIDVGRRSCAGHGVADRCEFRPGDFHEIDIEPHHYDLVVLGHVCRAEGSTGAARLIERAYAALAPEGRVLVTDYFADNDRKHNPQGVLMGMTMMANTVNGETLTHAQYQRWLADAGFEAVRLVEPIGFNQMFVATKPRRD